MMYKLSISFLFIYSIFFSQIGINHANPDPSTALDLFSTNKGFLPSKVPLIKTTDPNPVGTSAKRPINGLIVYNTESQNDVVPGYYVWQTDHWENIGNETRNDILYDDYINVDWLGYEPTGNMSTAPGTINVGGVNAVKVGCKKWSNGNGHSYCVYQLGSGVNWHQAFNFGKSMLGYLATITSVNEWNWIKANLIDNTTGYNLYNSIWLGFNKVKNPGNPYRLEWITGEVSKVNQNNKATMQHNFSFNQPDNSNNSEGCGHIFSTMYNDNALAPNNPVIRYWNDYPCNQTSNPAAGNSVSSPVDGSFNQIIIEFQN